MLRQTLRLQPAAEQERHDLMTFRLEDDGYVVS
jgi:hypothetical protein